MQTRQSLWTTDRGWTGDSLAPLEDADLVLVFGGRGTLQQAELLEQVRTAYPGAALLGCSTAGEIHGTRVHDDSLEVTAIRFEHTPVRTAEVVSRGQSESFETGVALAQELDPEGLSHVFLLSDGVNVNGSRLVEGLRSTLPTGVTMTGGLAGDGADFSRTLVFSGGRPEPDTIAAVGLYGPHIQIGSASLGGWDPFGPERTVTRSKDNVLYELDGKPALGLYKKYLGEHSEDLPASGLLFPLTIRVDGSEQPVVRTILGVDEESGTMTFAGDVPEGARARLMRANFDRLVEGASGAAKTSSGVIDDGEVELAILISCVGRKMVLKQRVEDELEAVRDVVGPGAVLTGFYSYGEISPFTPDARCELHNQTMTITTLSERRAA